MKIRRQDSERAKRVLRGYKCSLGGRAISMKAFGKTCLILAFATAEQPALAAETLLEDGAYKVEVRLELPHLEDLNYTSQTTLCLTSKENGNNHGFRVLSDNNPLRACAMQHIRQDGDALSFDIGCQSLSNLAKAKGVYTLSTNSFRGRIEMTMAGKNMTMSEIQTGHRIGTCKAAQGHS